VPEQRTIILNLFVTTLIKVKFVFLNSIFGFLISFLWIFLVLPESFRDMALSHELQEDLKNGKKAPLLTKKEVESKFASSGVTSLMIRDATGVEKIDVVKLRSLLAIFDSGSSRQKLGCCQRPLGNRRRILQGVLFRDTTRGQGRATRVAGRGFFE